MKTSWEIPEQAPSDFALSLPRYPRFFIQLLWSRRLRTLEHIERFLQPRYERDAHDPCLFRDMPRAVDRLQSAVARREKIAIWGDYDCDGVSGSAVLFAALRDLGHAQLTDVYIPDRNKEGYGLSAKGVSEAASQHSRVLITVDCGITNHEQIQDAQRRGIDVIVVDHHVVPEVLPPAYAVLNPKDPRSGYPFYGLAGTGTAFKLAVALARSSGTVSTPASLADLSYERGFLDLVALATLADSMPLADENRAMVREGLEMLACTRRVGLRALLRFCGLVVEDGAGQPSSISVRDALFAIVPRLNAMGRMDQASVSFRLLTTHSEEEALSLVRHLDEKNRERQMVTDLIVDEVRERLRGAREIPPLIFESSSRWMPGVLGLAAQRLMDLYRRPVILALEDGQRIVGTGRGVPGYNLVEVMRSRPELFLDCGGHPRAGGFTMKPENLDQVRRLFLESVSTLPLRSEPDAIVDAEVSGAELTWDSYDLLQSLAPFGEGNPEPQLLLKGLVVRDVRIIGRRQEHLKMRLATADVPGRNSSMDAVGWGLAQAASIFKAGDTVDVVANLTKNVWNGSRALQLQLVDISPS